MEVIRVHLVLFSAIIFWQFSDYVKNGLQFCAGGAEPGASVVIWSSGVNSRCSAGAHLSVKASLARLHHQASDQISGARSFMRSLSGSFRTSVRGTEEHKTFMACYPEAGPSFSHCFLVWLCVTRYVMITARKKDCSKKIGNTKDPLCQTGRTSREWNNWDRVSLRPTISAIYVTPLQVKLAWATKNFGVGRSEGTYPKRMAPVIPVLIPPRRTLSQKQI